MEKKALKLEEKKLYSWNDVERGRQALLRKVIGEIEPRIKALDILSDAALRRKDKDEVVRYRAKKEELKFVLALLKKEKGL